MEIVIHRGTHQIGGCVTEVRTRKTRLMVDFGAELCDDPQPIDIPGVTSGTKDCDAVVFTHYHGDHVGMIDSIRPDIPLYISHLSKRILLLSNAKMKAYENQRLEAICEYKSRVPFSVGDIVITPILADHSALGAHMLLIEGDGKKILHTGDFRMHGYMGKQLLNALDGIGQVDALVCEGTVLGREDSRNVSEAELSKRAAEILREHKYVFVLCASTNIDRIAAFCNAVPRGIYCLCDGYQKTIVEAVKNDPAFQKDAYHFPKLLTYGRNLDSKMRKQGFCMFVRANGHFRELITNFNDVSPVLVYSMWNGYREKEAMAKFLEGLDDIYLHTSGHADQPSIKTLIDKCNPSTIIPIHTETPERLRALCPSQNIIVANDGDMIRI